MWGRRLPVPQGVHGALQGVFARRHGLGAVVEPWIFEFLSRLPHPLDGVAEGLRPLRGEHLRIGGVEDLPGPLAQSDLALRGLVDGLYVLCGELVGGAR